MTNKQDKPRKAAKSKALAKKDKTPLQRLQEAKTKDEAQREILGMLAGGSLTECAYGLREAAEKWPDTFMHVSGLFLTTGSLLPSVLCQGGKHDEAVGRTVLAYRQRIIEELELSTAAEFMLLDAATDAYAHWLNTTALARATTAEGTGGETSKYQLRVAKLAQGHLRTFMEAMNALQEAKRPPVRVLHVKAGENVAIQINENKQLLEARYEPGLPQGDQRRMLPQSAPAEAEAADRDSD